ncbi:uncharacterized protein LOC143259695 isoform X2 [Megalopta genalis]|uniref:uncharacterized protein LOC143259695 isoform X2 n=1 Tax=Megalopta genalis TaxID=115081 RepID=UPI003FD0AE80
MLQATTLILFIFINAGLSYGMQCSFGERNILQSFIESCPGIFDSSDKAYCCYNIENNKVYCCDAYEFAYMSTWTAATVIVVGVIVAGLVIFCLSCVCCIFCRRYRRRNQGTVYEHVQVPRVVQVIHTPANVLPQSGYVINSTVSAPASNDMYAKPPPYNTSYTGSTNIPGQQ